MKYIASCSFGKDSIANILTALKHNEPLDYALFVEVMFDLQRNISGEVPEHIDWINNYAIPRLENLGVKTNVIRSDIDFLSDFYKKRGNRTKQVDRIGKYQGFLGGFWRCRMNYSGKIKPIRQYLKSINEPITQYVGIAADETKRFHVLNDQKISLLVKYNITENEAFEICKKENLLSPIYTMENRGGAGFVQMLHWFDTPILKITIQNYGKN